MFSVRIAYARYRRRYSSLATQPADAVEEDKEKKEDEPPTATDDVETTLESLGIGFVTFVNHDSAEDAVREMNAKSFHVTKDGVTFDKVIYVGRARKKAEGERELRAKYEAEKPGRSTAKFQDANPYVKKLNDAVTNIGKGGAGGLPGSHGRGGRGPMRGQPINLHAHDSVAGGDDASWWTPADPAGFLVGGPFPPLAVDPPSDGVDPTIQVSRESPHKFFTTTATAVERAEFQLRRAGSGLPSPLVDTVVSERYLLSVTPHNIATCTLIAAYNTSLPEGAICNLIETLKSTLVDGEADVSATEVQLTFGKKKPRPRRLIASSPRYRYAKSPQATPGASIPSAYSRFLESTAMPTLAPTRTQGYIVFEAKVSELNCTQIAANLSIVPGVYNVSVDFGGTVGDVSGCAVRHLFMLDTNHSTSHFTSSSKYTESTSVVRLPPP